MGLRPGSQSPDCTIKSYIDTSYDNVKTVSDNIDDVNKLASEIDTIKYGAISFVQEEVPSAEGITQGARWYKPSEPTMYIYYINEGETTGSWVEDNSVGDDVSLDTIEVEGGLTLRQYLASLDSLNGSLDTRVTANETKLAGIESGAQVNTVDTVAGKTGNVTLEGSDINVTGGTLQTKLNSIDSEVDEVKESLTLKVFQSPTDNLTKVTTYAGSVGAVFEVRKTSDNSLATIYIDKDGNAEIVQNGSSNVSDSAGAVEFFVEDTFDELKIEIGASSAKFKNNVFIQQHTREQGIGVWDVDTTYPVDGLAKGSDGQVYLCVSEQNGNDPVSDGGTNWIPYLYTNKIRYTTDILTSTSAVKFHSSSHYDNNEVALSGAIWKFTGTTTVPNAGNEDYINGFIYDANGRQYAIEGLVLPQQYGALADGVTDDVTPVNNAMRSGTYLLSGTYAVATSLFFQNTTTGYCEDATILALTDDFVVMDGNTKNNFHLLGKPKIKGPGMGVGTGTGILLFDCWGYTLDQPEVFALGNTIILDGTTPTPGGTAGHRGRQGKILNPTTHTCKFGPQILRRAEYTLWVNPQSTQCTQVGWTQEAGNTNVIGGNIQDNQNGVLLKEVGTTNANHGMFSSVNINHNVGYNLRCEDITYGHTFNGCHFYGDSALAGTIELIRSSGINITNGIIDGKIIIDGDVVESATVTGWNRISGNQIDETYTILDSINNGREKTIVSGNFSRNGDAWGINDRAFIEAKATAEGSSQTLTSNATTVILFPTEKSDNRGYYDANTGVFTTAQAVNMTIEFNTQFVLSGGTFVDGFVAVYVNGSAQSLAGIISTNVAGTSLVSSGQLTLAVSAGSEVTIRANVESTGGTITVGADVATNVSFLSSN